eukprot:gene20921-27769_t
MEYEPGEYQRLHIRQFPARTIRETAEGKYWRQFKTPTLAKQFGPVDHIDFCKQSPYSYAVTAATKVTVYDGNSRSKKRQFTRFKDIAFSGVFRDDGRLLAAGGQNGMLQLFDCGSRSVLRQFKAHQRPTHVARFSPDNIHILSGSDDVTARFWDIASNAQVARLDGHTDYVRAAAVSPSNMETWATGGYDHMVKLWDIRSTGCGGSGSQNSSSMMTMDHGAPVEDMQFFPSGSLLVTVGGNQLCVWDLVSGGKLLRRLTNFQKTVTCVRLSPMAGPDSAASPRMITGSLDGHVKIFELDTFKVTHASKYPAPVTAIGISPDCGLLAIGMADGMLSCRRHAKPKAIAGVPAAARPAKKKKWRPKMNSSNYRYFIRGQSTRAAVGDYKVAWIRRTRLQQYDTLLKQFRYCEAMTAALLTIVISILEELAARGGMVAAIGGRDSESLVKLLKFLVKYIVEPRYSAMLCNVTHRVLDTYTSVIGLSPEVDERLMALKDRVNEEVKLHEALIEIQGCLEPILAASMLADLKLE